MKRNIGMLLIALLISINIGCSTGTGIIPSGLEPSWTKTIDVPYTKQPNVYTCGPTSLRMVMEYYGVSKTVTEISNYMASIGHDPNPSGVGYTAITLAASNYGFNTSVKEDKSNWEELIKAIKAGKPCIAHLEILGNDCPRYYPSNEPAYSGRVGHYVVVVGLKADSNDKLVYVVVNDPARQGSQVDQGWSEDHVLYTYSSFDKAWKNDSVGKNRRLIILEKK